MAQGASSGVSKDAAEREVLAVEAEKQGQAAAAAAQSAARPKSLESMEADEEYKTMPVYVKWAYEAKAALYAWLGTGSEPL